MKNTCIHAISSILNVYLYSYQQQQQCFVCPRRFTIKFNIYLWSEWKFWFSIPVGPKTDAAVNMCAIDVQLEVFPLSEPVQSPFAINCVFNKMNAYSKCIYKTVVYFAQMFWCNRVKTARKHTYSIKRKSIELSKETKQNIYINEK